VEKIEVHDRVLGKERTSSGREDQTLKLVKVREGGESQPLNSGLTVLNCRKDPPARGKKFSWKKN